MLESMEGRRGMPRLKPPFPSQVGYLGRPTLINNVETLAHIPPILANGGDWYAGLGRNGGKGVRLWSVSGAVHQPGCFEAPNGITLHELIDGYGGGASEDIGAIVPGGAASGILPPDALDVPLTRDELREWGVGVGSAGVHALPHRQPGNALRARGARARSGRDVTRTDRRVARRDAPDLHLRARPGGAV